jgi:hypothetical protein
MRERWTTRARKASRGETKRLEMNAKRRLVTRPHPSQKSIARRTSASRLLMPSPRPGPGVPRLPGLPRRARRGTRRPWSTARARKTSTAVSRRTILSRRRPRASKSWTRAACATTALGPAPDLRRPSERRRPRRRPGSTRSSRGPFRGRDRGRRARTSARASASASASRPSRGGRRRGRIARGFARLGRARPRSGPAPRGGTGDTPRIRAGSRP